jgi:hypothetical protein
MIAGSANLKTLLYNSTNIKIGSGCYIEYNMNTMLDGVSATNNIADSVYTSQILRRVTSGPTTITEPGWPSTRPNPYKKLFPVDSIIKPFRPVNSGIKYFILEKPVSSGGPTEIQKNTFSNYRSVSYPESQPRIYYPGESTYYKYWVTPQNTGVNITINYLTNLTQYALTNKIVLKFESTHSIPSTYTIKIVKSNNTEETIANALTTPTNGLVELYYNGTSWSTVESNLFATPVTIKSIIVTTPSAGTDRIIGVTEVSARWIKDISTDVVSFEISKESSSSSEDLLPVGKVTANSINLELNRYNTSTLEYVSYSRTSSLNPSLTYMVKNAKLIPFFKIYHENGSVVDGLEKYDQINQGDFYINEFNISSQGEVSLTALDSAKYLMEVICPDILCESYPVTAIIRRLLDSVGYTNYKFNLSSGTDSSIPLINYFWTDGSKTVWEYLQELCRDIQMNAIVDENDVLQFYSRNYMYSRTTKDWNFYQEKEGSALPNIIDFSKKEMPSANQVKIRWSTPTTSEYLQSSDPLWQSSESFIIAGGLTESLNASGNSNIAIDLSGPSVYNKLISGFNFEGYFLVDSEIIEYDAMGYQYIPSETTNTTVTDAINGTVLNNGENPVNIWIESASDLSKYTALSKPPTGTTIQIKIKPNGRYRIKTRGALGTTAAAHNYSGAPSSSYSWTGVLVG